MTLLREVEDAVCKFIKNIDLEIIGSFCNINICLVIREDWY